jgi:energy-coupling factor transporter transmembrane protein EcfT
MYRARYYITQMVYLWLVKKILLKINLKIQWNFYRLLIKWYLTVFPLVQHIKWYLYYKNVSEHSLSKVQMFSILIFNKNNDNHN